MEIGVDKGVIKGIICIELISLLGIWIVFKDEVETHVSIGIFSFFVAIEIRGIIVLGRTLLMTEEGCTVSFLRFKKLYRWDEMKVKRIDRYYGPMANADIAMFSAHSVHKPKWCAPDTYSYLLHPFSTIFIYLVDEGKDKSLSTFEAEEKLFLEKMENWNVALEDTRIGIYRKRKEQD